MTATPEEQFPLNEPPPKPRRSVVHFLLRGVAISLPTILTLVVLVWVGGILNTYILKPTTQTVRFGIALFTNESRPASAFEKPRLGLPDLGPTVGRNYLISEATRQRLEEIRASDIAEGLPGEEINRRLHDLLEEEAWVPLPDERAVPYADYMEVARRTSPNDMPRSARGLYMELAATRYFGSLLHLSAVAVLLAMLILYFIGRLVTARMGAWMFQRFENGLMARVPLVSRVYGSVKQVTDFFFTERTVEYNRVVAVQYPRRGAWSIGFVTSDSFLELTTKVGEPLVSVLMPTSPMPMTGFTISVPRSEVIDLNLTVDQAFQFCLSCGVLVPPHQHVTAEKLRAAIDGRLESVAGAEPEPTPEPETTSAEVPAEATT